MTVLRVEGLRKRFGARRVLDGVSLSVGPGEVVVVRGDNGAGKSTLLQVIAGVLAGDEGSVVVAGAELGARRVEALRALGFAPERGDMPEHLLVIEWLDLIASLRRCACADEALIGRWQIGDLLGLRLGVLSLGQHRRVTLATSQLGEPRLWVLDEPTNGLDRATLGTLVAAIGEQAGRGGAVVCATHDQAFAAQIGGRQVWMQAGRLREGEAPAGLARGDHLRAGAALQPPGLRVGWRWRHAPRPCGSSASSSPTSAASPRSTSTSTTR